MSFRVNGIFFDDFYCIIPQDRMYFRNVLGYCIDTFSTIKGGRVYEVFKLKKDYGGGIVNRNGIFKQCRYRVCGR